MNSGSDLLRLIRSDVDARAERALIAVDVVALPAALNAALSSALPQPAMSVAPDDESTEQTSASLKARSRISASRMIARARLERQNPDARDARRVDNGCRVTGTSGADQ